MRKLLSLLVLFLLASPVFAQTTLNTTIGSTGYDGTNSSGSNSFITFVIENTSTGPILLTGVGNWTSSVDNGVKVTLWQSTTSLSGAVTLSTPTWTKVDSNIVSGIASATNAVNPVIPNMNYLIPAGATIRFALFTTGTNRYSGTSANIPTPNTFSANGVNLRVGNFQIAGGNVGYGGPNNPRNFTGSITFVPAGPCTNPPTAGTAVASATTVCSGATTTLNLSGASFGTGQTFQWQSSSDNVNWTNIAGATSSSYVATVTASTHYRCEVTCGTSATSASVLVNTTGGPLSGTYTLNKNAAASSTNFTSFAAIQQAFVCGSLAGNVTINVVPNSGPYTENFLLGSILGAGPNSRLTINGNGNTITYASAATADNYTVRLNGTDYITIDSLNIENTGTTAGWALHLTNGADHNIIRRSRISVSNSLTTTAVNPLVVNGSLTSPTTTGNSGNFNLFERNRFAGGYYNVVFAGNSTTRNKGNIVRNNRMEDPYLYGVFISGQDSIFIRKNDISRLLRSNITTAYGIYTINSGRHSELSGNFIHDMFAQGSTTTSTFYGIWNTSSDNGVGQEARVFNNIIANNNNDGLHYTIYNTGSDGWYYYHNTLIENHSNNTLGTTRVFFQTTQAERIEFRNNLIHLNRAGSGTHHAIYFGTATSTIVSNNNAVFAPSAGVLSNVHFGYSGSNQSTLSAWRTTTNQDANTVLGDPIYNSTVPFAPTAAYFNNIGANLQAQVPVDYAGVARGTAPDPGAYEFTPPPGPDMIIQSIVPQGGNSCGSTASFVVNLQNIGTDTVFTLTVNWSVAGVAQTPLVINDTFATGVIHPYTFGPVTLNPTGYTDVNLTLTNVGPGIEVDASNNSGMVQLRRGLSGTVTINQVGTPSETVFTSFSSLASALNSYGVCGPLTVNVLPNQGVFNEQFKLGEVANTSAINTITINGNGNTISNTSTLSADRGTVVFNGTDYVTIDSLTIEAAPMATTSTEFGFGVVLTNGADFNTIRNSRVISTQGSTSTNYAGIVISGSLNGATTQGLGGNNNLIENNLIQGGYYGVTLVGSSTIKGNDNRVLGNTIQDFYFYGVYAIQQDSMTIDGNSVSRPVRTTISSFYGIFASGNSEASKIVNNRVFNNAGAATTSTSIAYPIFTSGFSAVSGRNLVANNMVYDMNSQGTVYALYFSSSSNLDVFHNTVALIDPNPTTSTFSTIRGVFISGTTVGLALRNNLIAVDKDGGSTSECIHISSSGTYSIDNNAYFVGTNANQLGTFTGTGASTLSTWQSLTGFDANSRHGNPFFVNAAAHNYLPQNATFDNSGANLLAVVGVDINGQARTTTPDMGALEFVGAPCTGLSSLNLNTLTSNSANFSWNSVSSGVTAEWGPTGFKQASIVGTIVNVPSPASALNLTGLNPARCYDVYFTLNCTSSIPGAPSVIGPITFCTPCLSALSGVYTIGGTAGPRNFASLDSAISTLNSCGISAPVVFNMAGGNTYATAEIREIVGANATNTITFNSVLANMDTIAGVILNGADYLRFNNVAFAVPNGFAVRLSNGADYNNFNACSFITSTTSTTSADAAFVASSSATSPTGSGNNANHLSITNSSFIGGYYGISHYGPSISIHGSDLRLINNTFRDQYYYGVRVYYMDSVDVDENDISQGFRNTFSYGFNIYYCDFVNFRRNESYGAVYGAYIYGQALTNTSGTLRMENNMLSGSTYALWTSQSSNMQVYHNSLMGGRGLYIAGTTITNVDLRNNLFGATSATGFPLYIDQTPSVFTANYNAFDTTVSTNIANINGTNYANFNALRTAFPAQNANSVRGAATLSAPNNFRALGTLLNNVGDNTVGVNVDIDGQTRPGGGSTTVDIGADEYTPVTDDIALISARFDRNSLCLTSNDTLEVLIQNTIGGLKNFATTSLSFTYSVSGPVNSNGTFVLNTGSLASGQTTAVRIPGINMSIPGTYSLDQISLVSSTQNQSAVNDVLTNAASKIVVELFNALPDGVVFVNSYSDTVKLEVRSPFFAGKVFMTEICQFKTSSGAPQGGWPAYLTADDYIELTGVPGMDLSGITFEQYNTSGLVRTHVFPPQTLIGPNGTCIIMTGQGAVASQPSNYLYDARGNSTTTWSSGTASGQVLKDPSGNIIDAVSYGGFVFPATSGVTASDWSGTSLTATGTSGLRLEGVDANSPTNWVASASSAQDPNILNQNVSLPSAQALAGFSWSLNGSAYASVTDTIHTNWPASGVYNFVASYASPCGILTDTVVVIANLPCNLPSNFSANVVSCDSVVLNWNGAGDTTLLQIVASGASPSGGWFLYNDSSYVFNTGSLNTSYDVYLTNICGGDTLPISGPYSFAIANEGVPSAAFTLSSLNGFDVVLDASASTGGNLSYSWTFGDGNVGSGAIVNHTYTLGGSMTVKLVVSNGCGVDSSSLTIPNVNLPENRLGAGLKLYPNPTSETSELELGQIVPGDLQISLMDMSGKRVYSENLTLNTTTYKHLLEVGALAPGVYTLRVQNAGLTATRRLIVH